MTECVIEQSLQNLPSEPDLENYDFDPLIEKLLQGYTVNFSNGESVKFEQVAKKATADLCDFYSYQQRNAEDIKTQIDCLLSETAYDLLRVKADGKKPAYWKG